MVKTPPHIEDGLNRLNDILPLCERQNGLPTALANLHRSILQELALNGHLPTRATLTRTLGSDALEEALQRLAELDLVVLTDGQLKGAYPITTEKTAHQVTVNGHTIYAMCALDALSVASLFETDTTIDSSCAVTGTPIHVEQTNLTILNSQPEAPMVGIRWQQTCGHAAHSLCMEMIFLVNSHTADDWHGDDPESRSIYSLDDAVIFGQRFFAPLLHSH